jgi:hypothetical protein
MVTEKIFEAALGISAPWYIAGLKFEPEKRLLNVCIDFEVGSRFAVPEEAGEHPVHDTVSKHYRHLNFAVIAHFYNPLYCSSSRSSEAIHMRSHKFLPPLCASSAFKASRFANLS